MSHIFLELNYVALESIVKLWDDRCTIELVRKKNDFTKKYKIIIRRHRNH